LGTWIDAVFTAQAEQYHVTSILNSKDVKREGDSKEKASPVNISCMTSFAANRKVSRNPFMEVAEYSWI
jgi:hypothetical protein